MTAETRPPSTVDADGNWVRPTPGVAGMRTDGLLALGIAVGASLAILLYVSAEFFDEPPVLWQAALVVLGISGPLVWRRVAPITVTAVISIVYICALYNKVPEVLFSNIALFMAMYSIGAWSSSRRHALVARIVVVVAMFGWLFWEITRAAFDTSLAPEDSGIGLIAPGVAIGLISIVTNILYFAGAWAFGDRAWSAARERAELKARTHELEAERELTAAQAVTLDRVRIARELHDVVAHHVSVMGIQAGAARRALGADAPAPAISALGSVETSARDAVDELHRLVTTLRGIGGEGDATDGPSTRGTAQLEALLDDVRAEQQTSRSSAIGSRSPPSSTRRSTASHRRRSPTASSTRGRPRRWMFGSGSAPSGSSSKWPTRATAPVARRPRRARPAASGRSACASDLPRSEERSRRGRASAAGISCARPCRSS